VVRPWQERAARSGTASLDALADLAATLNDPQTLGMSLYWGWYLEEPLVAPPWGGPTELYHGRRQLRFWASLNPAQRQHAFSGAMISGEQMSGPQRSAFVTALTDPDTAPSEFVAPVLRSRRMLTPAELLSGGFRVKTGESRMQLFRGAKPNGEEEDLTGLYPSSRPPDLSKLPTGLQWSPVGPPIGVEHYTFTYYLAGDEKPARTAGISVIGPRIAQ
jgi:hypothetical protein